jgi:hypothetical protein
MPPVPLAVRRAGQVALETGARVRLGCSVERVVGSFTSPAVESAPRSRTGPRRADRLAGAAVPSRAPARCGTVDQRRGKAKGKRGRKERDAVAAMRALPDSESGRVDAVGGAGGLDWVAGPAG